MCKPILKKYLTHLVKAVRPGSSKAIIELTKGYRDYFKVQRDFYLTQLAQDARFTEITKATVEPTDEEDVQDARKVLETIFLATVGSSVSRGAVELLKEINIGADFGVSDLIAVEYAKARGAEMITKIDETTRKQINTIIVKGVEDGLDFIQVSKLITKKFASFSKTRAKFIAVNEIGNAYEVGKIKQAEDYSQRSGEQMLKKWVTQGDELVTELCNRNYKEGFINIEKPFSSGDDRPLRFPGCRCFTKYKSEGALALQ